MDEAITGSELTRAMLENGHEEIWCVVDDNCDQEAMSNLDNNDFTAHITSFENGMFYCTGGMAWLCAIPIKIVGITQAEAEIQTAVNII